MEGIWKIIMIPLGILIFGYIAYVIWLFLSMIFETIYHILKGWFSGSDNDYRNNKAEDGKSQKNQNSVQKPTVNSVSRNANTITPARKGIEGEQKGSAVRKKQSDQPSKWDLDWYSSEQYEQKKAEDKKLREANKDQLHELEVGVKRNQSIPPTEQPTKTKYTFAQTPTSAGIANGAYFVNSRSDRCSKCKLYRKHECAAVCDPETCTDFEP